MAAVEPARDKVARMLHDAVARLHEDIERVEFWTEVLGCLARPVPDYTPESSKLNHFNLPGREGRTRPARTSRRATKPRRFRAWGRAPNRGSDANADFRLFLTSAAL